MWQVKVKHEGKEVTYHFKSRDAAMIALCELSDKHVGATDYRITLERLGRKEDV